MKFVPNTLCACKKYTLPKCRNSFGTVDTIDNQKNNEYHGKGCCFTMKFGAPNNGLIAENWKENLS